MSNFSQFFPAGGASGGAGGGTSINEPATFAVTSTGNPDGYNATTGLYLNPDGGTYIKSGFLSTDTTTYPKGNISPAGPSTNRNISTTPPNAVTVIGNNIIFNQENSLVMLLRNAAGANTGTFTLTGGSITIITDIFTDGTDLYVTGNNLLEKYTSAGVFISTLTTSTGVVKFVGFDGTHFWAQNAPVSLTIYKYNTSFVYQNVSFTPTAGQLSSASNYGFTFYQNAWYGTGVNGGQGLSSYDTSFNLITDNLYNSILTNPRGIGSSTTTIYVANRSAPVVGGIAFAGGIGITAAKTDSDTGLPIFLRIK